MAVRAHKVTATRLRHALMGQRRHDLLWEAMRRGREGRAKAYQLIDDPVSFREHARKIREKSLDRLDELLARFVTKASERGAKVYLARGGDEAINYVLGVAERVGAKLISKSKSLTSEEIEFNKPLEERGFKVVETDLGERIIQMAREKPFHLVFPAVHKSVKEVAELLSEDLGSHVEPTFENVMDAVRKSLREVFLDTDIGVTGANIAIAETGTIVLETNEGNGRLVSTIPRVHIVIMGMEKIVETLEDAIHLIRAHPMSATGQTLTNYVSLISGRCPFNMGEEERETHIVILDNGRSRMRGDSWFKEALYCIRCGACMNVCPTYSVAGGHVFGHIYPGPIGIPWTAKIHGIKAAAFSTLCISCGLCREACPVDIDIPLLIAKVKNEDVKTGGQPLVNKMIMGYERFYSIARPVAPLFNWMIGRKVVRIMMEYLAGVDRRRPVPRLSKTTFMMWYERSRRKPGRGDLKVTLFLDFFPNYVSPWIAVKTLDFLEQAGVEVALPMQKSSGYPYIAYGDLEKAREYARYNVGHLEKLVDDGYEIVSLEPTATYSLKYTYPKLLDFDKSATSVASKTCGLMEYLWRLVENCRLRIVKAGSMGRVGLHISCHQRGLDSASHAALLLRKSGYEVQIVETGTCCGMAGSFGMKKGLLGYELANEVGKPLFQLFKESGMEVIVSESSVCKIHLEQGTSIPVKYPIELLTLESCQ
ncbi:MAG: LUD domain-containing protein [Nitrososphaerota archaeon]